MRSEKLRKKVVNDEQGQALIETALVITVLLLLLMGLLDLGRVYFTYLALQNAAAEGAAYGMLHPTWQTSDAGADPSIVNPDPENIDYRARNESEDGLVNWSGITVTVDSLFPTPGNPLTVTVTYDYEVLTPVGQVLAGDTITLRASARQTILRDDVAPPP
jgi:Flp pilus assembly protein TadG